MPKAFDRTIHLCIRRPQRKVKADGCILLDNRKDFVGTPPIRGWVDVTVEEETVKGLDDGETVATFKKAA